MLRISDLLAHGRSHVKGLYSARTGKTFDADLVLTETTNKDGQRIVSYELDFPKNSKRSGCDHPNRKPATGSLLSFSTLFDVDFGELNEEDFGLYLMVCSPYLEVKASLKRLKALTSKPGEHEK